MSGTPNFSSFNKNKVANKFGIQLKNKDTNKQSQQPLTPSTETKMIDTKTSTVTDNKTVSELSVQNQSNGFQSNTNIIQHSTLSKTSEPIRKTLGNSIQSKSNIELISTPIHHERRDSLNSDDHHSTSLNLPKSNQLITSSFQSSSSILIPSKSPEMIKRSSAISIDRSLSPEPSSIRRISITKTPERTVSPEPSSIKRMSIVKTLERPVSPEPSSIKRMSIVKILERPVSPEPSSIKRMSIVKTLERPVSPEPSSIKRMSIVKILERPVSPEPSSIKRMSIAKTPERPVSPEPSSIKRMSIVKILERPVSPEPSSIKRMSITKTPERSVSPSSPTKRPSIPTTITKTEAQIEHQKDQPLYKRQLSKALDNPTSLANKNKHQHELTTLSTTILKR